MDVCMYQASRDAMLTEELQHHLRPRRSLQAAHGHAEHGISASREDSKLQGAMETLQIPSTHTKIVMNGCFFKSTSPIKQV